MFDTLTCSKCGNLAKAVTGRSGTRVVDCPIDGHQEPLEDFDVPPARVTRLSPACPPHA
jgi:hypothetical protein